MNVLIKKNTTASDIQTEYVDNTCGPYVYNMVAF